MKIYRQAYEYQENGMIGMTIEMTSGEVTNAIAKKLRIPVISVATSGCGDGSEMVIFDLIGLLPLEMMSKHSKAYASVLMDVIKGTAICADEFQNKVFLFLTP